MKANGSTFGHASCDSCHTRHTFSVAEAKQPEACASCHMGFDHPQWEMYSTSKHGIRHSLKRDGILPETASAPTCQDCHMSDGNHEVRTAWGFLAVRTNGLERYPGESDQWWADRVTILMALGVLDPEGNPTARLELVSFPRPRIAMTVIPRSTPRPFGMLILTVTALATPIISILIASSQMVICVFLGIATMVTPISTLKPPLCLTDGIMIATKSSTRWTNQ